MFVPDLEAGTEESSTAARWEKEVKGRGERRKERNEKKKLKIK